MTPIPPSQIPKDLTEAYERAVNSMAIQLERDALLSYTNLCEEHKRDCATGHRLFAKCASCLLTTATRMRFKAENERDEAEQRIAKLTAEVEHLKDEQEDYKGRLWCALGQPLNIEFIAAAKAVVAENTHLKAPVSNQECLAFENSYGEKLMLNYVDFGLSEFLASRATRTPPQEGQ